MITTKNLNSVQHDGGIEVDTAVIFTSKIFIPRSINVNLIVNGFGLSVNVLDANLRLEGLDELLRGVFVDKLTSEKLLKRLTEKPEQLIPILQALADKVSTHTHTHTCLLIN